MSGTVGRLKGNDLASGVSRRDSCFVFSCLILLPRYDTINFPPNPLTDPPESQHAPVPFRSVFADFHREDCNNLAAVWVHWPLQAGQFSLPENYEEEKSETGFHESLQ